MHMYEILEKLTDKAGISGFEDDIAVFLENTLNKFCDEVRIDDARCVTGIIRSGKVNAKKIMLEAHLDRIGLIVSEIHDNGFVSFSTIGGIDKRILPASEVLILGKSKVYGVVGAKPPHLITSSDSKALKIEDMTIDTGIQYDELCKKISVGDPILITSPLRKLLGNIVSSPALDNRAGIAAILHCLERIDKSRLAYDIYISFTSGEESGLHGAYTLLRNYAPDLAVIVDVTHGSTHDKNDYTTFPLGSGPVICRGPSLHHDMTKEVINLLEKNNLPYNIEIASGNSGTNAWAFQTQHGGIPCVLVSIPLRYMHTTVETVDLNDISATTDLLAKIIYGGVSLA